MKKVILIAALLLLSALPVLGQSNVTVIHGIPGLPEPVVVKANGDVVLPAFEFQDIEGPLPLPAGDYVFTVELAGDEVLRAEASLPGFGDFTAIAHLTPDGSESPIALTLFANDVSPIEFGDTRIIVRHTANAPPVNVQIDNVIPFNFFGRLVNFGRGQIRLPGLENAAEGNGQVGAVDIPSPATRISLRAGGSPVFDSGVLPLARNTVYIAYAVGDFFDGPFTVLLQVIDRNAMPAPALEADGMWVTSREQ